MYSNIKSLSRAGLVTLFFVLISISLISAAPISISAPPSSSLSSHGNPVHHVQDHIQHDPSRIARTGHISRAPVFQQDTYEDSLVRRTSIAKKIRNAFKKVGNGIKHAAQKIGSGIKRAAQKVGHGIQKVAQKVGHGIKKAAQNIGHGIKRAAQKVGHGIKKAAQKVGHGIKRAAQKVGHGVKTAAKKVGHFVKANAAKVAKFGLKVVQSVGGVIGKVASFVPVIGKVAGKVIDGASKVAGVVSDHIHAKLSNKLQKGMNVMNKANKIMGYIPRRRDLSEEEAFQQRDDITDAYYFEDLQDISLEHREGSYFDDDYEPYLDGDWTE